MSSYKYSIVAIGRNLQSYPYLAKMYDALSSLGKTSYLHWDRDIGNNPLYKWALFSGKPRNKIMLLFFYCLWVSKLFFFFLSKADRNTIYFCSRLDAAFPAYFVGFFGVKIKYIYLDRDAYHMAYKLGVFRPLIKFIETSVASKALRHFIPGESRNFTKLSNVCVIHNTPSFDFLEKAKVLSEEKKRSIKFTVYINGWLTDTRGSGFILKAVKKLDPEVYNVYVAGPSECEAIDELKELPVVEYLGQISNIEALSYYYLSDVVFSFYDPSIEVNRNAEPNKWYDCAFTGTAFITNNGIATYNLFKKDGYSFLVDYGDAQGLLSLVEVLNLKKTKELLNVNPYYKDLDMDFWDYRVKHIVLNL